MVRADFYDDAKSFSTSSYLGSVSMDLPRITSRFMKNVLYSMRMIDQDEEVWCYLYVDDEYVDDEYVGIINYSGLFENYMFVNSKSSKVFARERRRWMPYDRKAG